MKKTLAAVLLTAICAYTTTASAAIISLNNDFSNGKMSNGTYSSVFNGTAGLAPYTINSLSFSFTFSDDADDTLNKTGHDQSASASAYMLHKPTGIYFRHVSATDTTTYAGQQEHAALWFGDSLLGSGNTGLTTSEKTLNVAHALEYDGIHCPNGKQSCGYAKSIVTTTTKKVINDYTGDIEIKGLITNESILKGLLNDGQFWLNLKVGGDLMLTGAKVVLDYTIIDTTAQVPEPSSVLLAGVGLAAIGLARRRRGAAKA